MPTNSKKLECWPGTPTWNSYEYSGKSSSYTNFECNGFRKLYCVAVNISPVFLVLVFLFLSLLEPHSLLGDKLLGFRVHLSPKPECRSGRHAHAPGNSSASCCCNGIVRLNWNTCIRYVKMWELKPYFYPAHGKLKKKKKKKTSKTVIIFVGVLHLPDPGENAQKLSGLLAIQPGWCLQQHKRIFGSRYTQS